MPYRHSSRRNWEDYSNRLAAHYKSNPPQPGPVWAGQGGPMYGGDHTGPGIGWPGAAGIGANYTGAPVAATSGLGQPGAYGGELGPEAVSAVAGRFPTPVQAGTPGGFGQAMSRLRPGMAPGVPAGVGGTLGEIVSAPGGGGPGGLFGGAAQSLGSRFGGPKGPVTLGGGRQMSGGDYDEYVRQREARRAGIRT